MEIENTSIRLKQIMKERKLRQVDLLEMVKPFCEKYNVKINKSDISQYLSGKVKPGQEKLSMLGMALNLNEAWLMGYDVQKEKQHYTKVLNLSKEETTLLENYNKLDTNDKTKVIDYTNLLSNQDKYKSANKSASEITATTDNVVELDIQSSNSKNECYTLAAHDDDLNEETKKRNLEKVKNIFKQMDEE